MGNETSLYNSCCNAEEKKKTYDCYLSYDFGIDTRGRSTSSRVRLVYQYLNKKGYECLTDEMAMKLPGNRSKMQRIKESIDSSHCVISFLTQRYLKCINGVDINTLRNILDDNVSSSVSNLMDICPIEFAYGIALKGGSSMIPVIFDDVIEEMDSFEGLIDETFGYRIMVNLNNFENISNQLEDININIRRIVSMAKKSTTKKLEDSAELEKRNSLPMMMSRRAQVIVENDLKWERDRIYFFLQGFEKFCRILLEYEANAGLKPGSLLETPMKFLPIVESEFWNSILVKKCSINPSDIKDIYQYLKGIITENTKVSSSNDAVIKAFESRIVEQEAALANMKSSLINRLNTIDQPIQAPSGEISFSVSNRIQSQGSSTSNINESVLKTSQGGEEIVDELNVGIIIGEIRSLSNSLNSENSERESRLVKTNYVCLDNDLSRHEREGKFSLGDLSYYYRRLVDQIENSPCFRPFQKMKHKNRESIEANDADNLNDTNNDTIINNNNDNNVDPIASNDSKLKTRIKEMIRKANPSNNESTKYEQFQAKLTEIMVGLKTMTNVLNHSYQCRMEFQFKQGDDCGNGIIILIDGMDFRSTIMPEFGDVLSLLMEISFKVTNERIIRDALQEGIHLNRAICSSIISSYLHWSTLMSSSRTNERVDNLSLPKRVHVYNNGFQPLKMTGKEERFLQQTLEKLYLVIESFRESGLAIYFCRILDCTFNVDICDNSHLFAWDKSTKIVSSLGKLADSNRKISIRDPMDICRFFENMYYRMCFRPRHLRLLLLSISFLCCNLETLVFYHVAVQPYYHRRDFSFDIGRHRSNDNLASNNNNNILNCFQKCSSSLEDRGIFSLLWRVLLQQLARKDHQNVCNVLQCLATLVMSSPCERLRSELREKEFINRITNFIEEIFMDSSCNITDAMVIEIWSTLCIGAALIPSSPHILTVWKNSHNIGKALISSLARGLSYYQQCFDEHVANNVNMSSCERDFRKSALEMYFKNVLWSLSRYFACWSSRCCNERKEFHASFPEWHETLMLLKDVYSLPIMVENEVLSQLMAILIGNMCFDQDLDPRWKESVHLHYLFLRMMAKLKDSFHSTMDKFSNYRYGIMISYYGAFSNVQMNNFYWEDEKYVDIYSFNESIRSENNFDINYDMKKRLFFGLRNTYAESLQASLQPVLGEVNAKTVDPNRDEDKKDSMMDPRIKMEHSLSRSPSQLHIWMREGLCEMICFTLRISVDEYSSLTLYDKNLSKLSMISSLNLVTRMTQGGLRVTSARFVYLGLCNLLVSLLDLAGEDIRLFHLCCQTMVNLCLANSLQIQEQSFTSTNTRKGFYYEEEDSIEFMENGIHVTNFKSSYDILINSQNKLLQAGMPNALMKCMKVHFYNQVFSGKEGISCVGLLHNDLYFMACKSIYLLCKDNVVISEKFEFLKLSEYIICFKKSWMDTLAHEIHQEIRSVADMFHYYQDYLDQQLESSMKSQADVKNKGHSNQENSGVIKGNNTLRIDPYAEFPCVSWLLNNNHIEKCNERELLNILEQLFLIFRLL